MEHYNLQLTNWVLGSIVVAGACRYLFNHVKRRSQRMLAERKRQILWLTEVKQKLLEGGIAYRRYDQGGYVALPVDIAHIPQELYRLDFSVEEAVTPIRLLRAVTDGEEILK